MSAYPASSNPPNSNDGPSTNGASSLPSRPPQPSLSRGFKPAFASQQSSTGGTRTGSSGSHSFAGFAPRAVASANRPFRTSSPAASAGYQVSSTYSAQPTYHTQANYADQLQQQRQMQQQTHCFRGNYNPDGTSRGTPNIHNPFAPPTAASSAGAGAYGGHGAHTHADSDMEAQIAQWQSAYASKDDGGKANQKPGGPQVKAGPTTANSNSGPYEGKVDGSELGNNPSKKALTVQRSGGGQSWSDTTLLEWDPAHFRIFVGNLAGEVTDESLLKAFARYPSVQKARVIRDKTTTKSKGYGFVSFSDGDEYFKAARDMNNKYIGSHPVKIKKSTTEIKATVQRDHRHQYNNHNNNRKGSKPGHKATEPSSTAALGPTPGGGVTKKQSKTRGGLKIIG